MQIYGILGMKKLKHIWLRMRWENLRHKPEYFANLSGTRLQQVVAQKKAIGPITKLISVLLNDFFPEPPNDSFQNHKLFDEGILKQAYSIRNYCSES